jgi:RNA polymerase-binding transcription factor DksA
MCVRNRTECRRIDTGEYGYCIKCGEEIGDQRLAPGSVAATRR